MIFGHRGLSSLAPENTMAAFRYAVHHQVQWVEADVDVIADGTVIICHDSTLDRTTNRAGRYDDLTVADLALEAYEKALQPKKLLTMPGGHFAAYIDNFSTAGPGSRDWFAEHLK